MSTLEVKSIAAPSGYTLGMPAGHVLQVVQATFLDTMSSTSNGTFVNITDLTVTITPRSTSSKFLLTTNINYSAGFNAAPSLRFSGGNSTSYVGNVRGNRRRVGFGGGDDFFNGSQAAGENTAFSASMSYLDSPVTASAITYVVQCMTDGNGAIYINREHQDPNSSGEGFSGASSFTVMEIAG